MPRLVLTVSSSFYPGYSNCSAQSLVNDLEIDTGKSIELIYAPIIPFVYTDPIFISPVAGFTQELLFDQFNQIIYSRTLFFDTRSCRVDPISNLVMYYELGVLITSSGFIPHVNTVPPTVKLDLQSYPWVIEAWNIYNGYQTPQYQQKHTAPNFNRRPFVPSFNKFRPRVIVEPVKKDKASEEIKVLAIQDVAVQDVVTTAALPQTKPESKEVIDPPKEVIPEHATTEVEVALAVKAPESSTMPHVVTEELKIEVPKKVEFDFEAFKIKFDLLAQDYPNTEQSIFELFTELPNKLKILNEIYIKLSLPLKLQEECIVTESKLIAENIKRLMLNAILEFNVEKYSRLTRQAEIKAIAYKLLTGSALTKFSKLHDRYLESLKPKPAPKTVSPPPPPAPVKVIPIKQRIKEAVENLNHQQVIEMLDAKQITFRDFNKLFIAKLAKSQIFHFNGLQCFIANLNLTAEQSLEIFNSGISDQQRCILLPSLCGLSNKDFMLLDEDYDLIKLNTKHFPEDHAINERLAAKRSAAKSWLTEEFDKAANQIVSGRTTTLRPEDINLMGKLQTATGQNLLMLALQFAIQEKDLKLITQNIGDGILLTDGKRNVFHYLVAYSQLQPNAQITKYIAEKFIECCDKSRKSAIDLLAYLDADGNTFLLKLLKNRPLNVVKSFLKILFSVNNPEPFRAVILVKSSDGKGVPELLNDKEPVWDDVRGILYREINNIKSGTIFEMGPRLSGNFFGEDPISFVEQLLQDNQFERALEVLESRVIIKLNTKSVNHKSKYFSTEDLAIANVRGRHVFESMLKLAMKSNSRAYKNDLFVSTYFQYLTNQLLTETKEYWRQYPHVSASNKSLTIGVIFHPSIPLERTITYAIKNHVITLIVFSHFLAEEKFDFDLTCLCETLVKAEQMYDYSLFDYLYENIPPEKKSDPNAFRAIRFNLMITAMACFHSSAAVRYLVRTGFDLKILASNDQTILYTLFQAYYINSANYKIDIASLWLMVQELCHNAEMARFFASYKIEADGAGQSLVDFVAISAYKSSGLTDAEYSMWKLLLENGLPIQDYRLNGKNILHIAIYFQSAKAFNLFAQYLEPETLTAMLNERHEGLTLLDLANNAKKGLECSTEVTSAIRLLYANNAVRLGKNRFVI